MRSYKSIYSKNDQDIIEDSMAISRDIAKLIPFLRIHSEEQIRCLKAGSALGSILITFSIMECVILLLLATGLNDNDEDIKVRLLHEYEWERKRFKEAIDLLKDRAVIKQRKANLLIKFYDMYRIPLSHGLFTKGIFSETLEARIGALTKQTKRDQRIIPRWTAIEEIIEECIHVENKILNILDEVIEKNIYAF